MNKDQFTCYKYKDQGHNGDFKNEPLEFRSNSSDLDYQRTNDAISQNEKKICCFYEQCMKMGLSYAQCVKKYGRNFLFELNYNCSDDDFF